MTDQDVRRFDFGDTPGTIEDDTFTPTTSAAPGTSMGPSPLDQLRETITAAVTKPDLTLAVLSRPGLAIRFGTNIDLDILQQWRRRSHDKHMPDNWNILKFSQLVIANTAKAMVLNGEEPLGQDGEPVSFRSPELLEWTSTKRALDAVRGLYDNDGHIIATAQDVLEAAGYGDEMMEPEEGPTKRS